MAWPHSQEYNGAIQNPATSFSDAELRQGQTVAVKALFENQFDQVVVEFRGGVQTFTHGGEALRYALGKV